MDKELQQLKEKVEKLEKMLSSGTMPFDLRETIRNEVVLQEDSSATLTQSISTPAEGAPLVVPAAYIGTILVRSKGKLYKVPYIS